MKVEITDLVKEYDSLIALDGVCIKMKNGVFGLLGPNGAGKSTLIKILAGLENYQEGKISINDKSITKNNELKKYIGYVPQEFSFYPYMTVYDIMQYFSNLNYVKTNKKEIIHDILETTHLLDYMGIKIKNLSGGTKQRLGIAVALIKDPKLLLVDEPTVGLDPAERIHFNNVLTSFSKDRVVLLSTHIVSDVESACNELAILDKGQIIYSGGKTALIEQCMGKVWEISVTFELSIKLEDEYIVSSKILNKDGAILKIISDEKPYPHAKLVDSDLTDAYLFAIANK